MSGPVRSVGRRPGTRAGIDWASQPLGRVTDNALARALGVNFGTVQKARKVRGIPRFQRSRVEVSGAAALVGKLTDREIGRLLGVHDTTIAQYRRRRGIPSAAQPRVDWDGMPLGLYYDTEIACAIGCSTNAVSDARRRRGIPPFRDERVCGCGRRYVARERDQRGCSDVCSQVSSFQSRAGKPPKLIPLLQGLAALRRDVRGRLKGQ